MKRFLIVVLKNIRTSRQYVDACHKGEKLLAVGFFTCLLT